MVSVVVAVEMVFAAAVAVAGMAFVVAVVGTVVDLEVVPAGFEPAAGIGLAGCLVDDFVVVDLDFEPVLEYSVAAPVDPAAALDCYHLVVLLSRN